MKTPAIEDFAEIARNRVRINQEQTWRAKDATYGPHRPKSDYMPSTATPIAVGQPTCRTCGFITTDPAGDCDGGCLGG